MTKWLSLVCFLLTGLVAGAQWRGGDLSFLPSIEAVDYVYKDAAGSAIEDVPQWMADQGMNLARYRLWNDPERLYNALPGVVQEAKRMQEAGMDILIDFHFSDSWADPGQQVAPRMWRYLSFEEAQDAMACWIVCVMETFAQEGVDIAMVQLGNETDPGMMHPHGTLDDGFGNLASLLQAGHDAVPCPVQGRWSLSMYPALISLPGISPNFKRRATRLMSSPSATTASGTKPT